MKPSADGHTSSIPFIAVSTARLPKTVAGDQPGILMVELAVDSPDRHIVDIATTVTLPSYSDLLRRLLIGRPLGEVECATPEICSHLRGPLLKPTIAALASAVANAANRAATAGPGGDGRNFVPE